MQIRNRLKVMQDVWDLHERWTVCKFIKVTRGYAGNAGAGFMQNLRSCA
jgi:hypothetical protein